MIVIDGLELEILPRAAIDVIRLAEHSRNDRSAEHSASKNVFEYAYILHSSLKLNASRLPWFRFLKKRKILRITRPEYLISALSITELGEAVLNVFRAEGVPEDDLSGDKKKAPLETATT